MGTLLIFVSVLIYVNVVTMTHATKVFPVVEEQYAGTFVADVREIYNPRIVDVTSSSLQVTKMSYLCVLARFLWISLIFMKSLSVIFDVIDNSNKNTALTFVIVTESIFDEQFTSAVQIDDTKDANFK